VSVTISIGVSGFPDHASTLDRLERLADAALYLAKRLGRNRVELAEPMAIAAPAGLPEPEASGSGAGAGDSGADVGEFGSVSSSSRLFGRSA
jgi:hypothetical protein